MLFLRQISVGVISGMVYGFLYVSEQLTVVGCCAVHAKTVEDFEPMSAIVF